MGAKKWYMSKTLWANAAALVAGAGDYLTTGNLAALSAAGLAVVNMALRVVTKQPLE